MRSASPISYPMPAPCMVPIRSPIPPKAASPVPNMVFPETAKLVFFARKAHGGKKKRTLIRAVMNPPAYSGTRSRGPVPLPLVGETPHMELNQRGRLAPRWLQDFVSGELEEEVHPNEAFQYVGCASDDFRREEARKQGGDYPDDVTPPAMRHELLLKGHQSFPGEPASDQPLRRADGSECDEVLACVCQNCRYHFTFYIDRKSNRLCGATRGNNSNNADPFHHLVYVLSEKSAPRSINPKLYPFHGQAKYTCSSTTCAFKLTVEISKPRLSDHFLAFLTDNDGIRNRLKRAVEDEPERFADVANVTPNALAYLRAYLRDIVEGRSEKNPDGTEIERKIDQRNKKFFIQFGNGPEAAELLTYLGFEEIVDEDSRAWKVPCPTITRPTRPGSQLAFYQDVKSEVETIIGKDSQNMKPNAAISFITNALDIGDFATSDQAYNEYRMTDYATLGLLPRMHERYFWYAYTCQSQTDPELQDDYFICLKRLAQGRNNEDLELRVQSYDSVRTNQPKESIPVASEEDDIRLATERSLQDAQAPTVPRQLSNDDKVIQAYNYFGLDENQRSDDEVLGKFLSNSEAYPSQKSSYREKLLLIARHTQSMNLERMAVEDMSTEESLNYLGVQKDTDASYMVSIAQFSCTSNEKDRALVAAALRQISKERGDDPMLASAAQDILVGERDGSSANPSGQMDVDSFADENLILDLALPAGLKNIRNTCYLNSILQYFNTVKPIHEILDNFDELGLPGTEASLQSRRIDPGSAHLERGEAYAGRQFVQQLSSLFNNMQQCQTVFLIPKQRLAIAALKNSAGLESDGKRIYSQTQGEQNHSLSFDLVNPERAGSPAPPLPVRHAAAPSASPQNTAVHVNSPASLKGTTTVLASDPDNDSSSIRSSQTLVDQGEARGQSLDEGRRGSTAEEGWQNIPQVSVSMEEVPEEDVAVSDVPIVVHAKQVEDNGSSFSPDVTMSGTGGDTTMGDVSAPATTNSQTKETAAGNVQVVFDPPPVAQPSVESVIELALEDTSVKGTDQQDVEEVMGNIISHLRAAVKATGEDTDTGVQRDPITDTFFWTSATYSRSDRAGRYNRQVAPNRWVTAFPAEKKKISLLQALSSSFQREFITQGTWYERFTSIVDLPPILHIHIQRSRGDGTKNKTFVDIPQTLHLDQFMDCLEGSDLFARRRHAWNLQERIRSLRGPNGEESAITFHPNAIGKAAAYTDMVVKQHLQQGRAKSSSLESREVTAEVSADATAAAVTGVALEATADATANTTTEAATVTAPFVNYHPENINDLFSGIDYDDSEGTSDGGEYDMIDDEIQELMCANGVAINTPTFGPELGAGVDAKLDETYGTSETSKQFLDDARRLTTEEVEQSWARQDLVQSGNDAMRTLQQTRAEYERELEGLFDDLKSPEYEYLLHAVVCHSGNTGKAGHYWVWIYDFDRCLWRKYNDKIVREHPNTDAVMEELSNGGEPYYLAYVRASDVKNFVGVPLRKERSSSPGIQPPPPRPQSRSLPVIPEAGRSTHPFTPSSMPDPSPPYDEHATKLAPAPPKSNSGPRLLTTPTLEEDEPKELSVGGLDGQGDGKEPPLPSSVPLPGEASNSDGQMQ